jgi:hypothetical protein
MANLYHINCHKTLDCQRVEVVVVIVVYTQTNMDSVVCTELEVLKIPMFATNGDRDILKDNGIINPS